MLQSTISSSNFNTVSKDIMGKKMINVGKLLLQGSFKGVRFIQTTLNE
jgi:hypothetical protein